MAQRGGVDGSVRPGLRPANLDGQMEPIRIRQVIRLAVPVTRTGAAYGCGSAPALDRLPLNADAFSVVGASKPRAGARRQRRLSKPSKEGDALACGAV